MDEISSGRNGASAREAVLADEPVQLEELVVPEEANTANEGFRREEHLEEEESLSPDSELIVAEALVDPAGPAVASPLKAIIEAAIYITDEPLTPEQMAAALEHPLDLVKEVLAELVAEYAASDRGLAIRELAGGYKMSTKPEHHEAIRRFVRNLQPPLKLSLAALETLAVIAYKQPITAPEIMEIRGVQGAGVLKTLLDRKLIATAGRKNVIGKPILYKTTREFLVQFGLKDLAELPTLKEFEELGRIALSDAEEMEAPPPPAAEPQADGAEVPVGDPEPPEGNTPPVDPPVEPPAPPKEPPEPDPDPVQEPPEPNA